MTMSTKPDRQILESQGQKVPKSGPSGASDRPAEREKKFDEEGGDQPQAPSQQAVDKELQQVQEEKRQEQTGQGQFQWTHATSMGSEGVPHSEGNQRSAPAPFEPPVEKRSGERRAFLDGRPVERRAFRHQAGR